MGYGVGTAISAGFNLVFSVIIAVIIYLLVRGKEGHENILLDAFWLHTDNKLTTVQKRYDVTYNDLQASAGNAEGTCDKRLTELRDEVYNAQSLAESDEVIELSKELERVTESLKLNLIEVESNATEIRELNDTIQNLRSEHDKADQELEAVRLSLQSQHLFHQELNDTIQNIRMERDVAKERAEEAESALRELRGWAQEPQNVAGGVQLRMSLVEQAKEAKLDRVMQKLEVEIAQPALKDITTFGLRPPSDQSMFKYFHTDVRELKDFISEMNMFITDLRQIFCVVFNKAIHTQMTPNSRKQWQTHLPEEMHREWKESKMMQSFHEMVRGMMNEPFSFCAELERSLEEVSFGYKMNKLAKFGKVGVLRKAFGVQQSQVRYVMSDLNPLDNMRASLPNVRKPPGYNTQSGKDGLKRLCKCMSPRIQRLIKEAESAYLFMLKTGMNPLRLGYDLMFGCAYKNGKLQLQTPCMSDIDFEHVAYFMQNKQKREMPIPLGNTLGHPTRFDDQDDVRMQTWPDTERDTLPENDISIALCRHSNGFCGDFVGAYRSYVMSHKNSQPMPWPDILITPENELVLFHRKEVGGKPNPAGLQKVDFSQGNFQLSIWDDNDDVIFSSVEFKKRPRRIELTLHNLRNKMYRGSVVAYPYNISEELLQKVLLPLGKTSPKNPWYRNSANRQLYTNPKLGGAVDPKYYGTYYRHESSAHGWTGDMYIVILPSGSVLYLRTEEAVGMIAVDGLAVTWQSATVAAVEANGYRESIQLIQKDGERHMYVESNKEGQGPRIWREAVLPKELLNKLNVSALGIPSNLRSRYFEHGLRAH